MCKKDFSNLIYGATRGYYSGKVIYIGYNPPSQRVPYDPVTQRIHFVMHDSPFGMHSITSAYGNSLIYSSSFSILLCRIVYKYSINGAKLKRNL